MSGSAPKDQKLFEMQKNASRMQKLYEHLKPSAAKAEDQEKSYQEYCDKHKLKQHRIELIAVSYMAESENPLKFIADYIYKQPDAKIIIKRETEDCEKRLKIYTNLIQPLMQEKPLSLKEIEDFSRSTVSKEFIDEKNLNLKN